LLPRACVAIAFRVCSHGRAMNYTSLIISSSFIGLTTLAPLPTRRGTTHIVSFTQNGGAGTPDGSGFGAKPQRLMRLSGSGAFDYSEGDRYRSQRSVRRLRLYHIISTHTFPSHITHQHQPHIKVRAKAWSRLEPRSPDRSSDDGYHLPIRRRCTLSDVGSVHIVTSRNP